MTVRDEPDPPSPSRAGFLPLVGGALALDFANTQSGVGTDSHQNHLRAPEHVALWIEHAASMEKEEVARLRATLAVDPSRAAALLEGALALRSAVSAVGGALAARAEPPKDALTKLAAMHARWLAKAELSVEGGAGRWRWNVSAAPVEAALGPIALSAVRLFIEGDFGRIKRCGGDACGWLFVDATKNNSRRWCEMEVCGNRAKQKRLAARRRSP
jgi:predicted RNA-binding Zn ribbon-like protein